MRPLLMVLSPAAAVSATAAASAITATASSATRTTATATTTSAATMTASAATASRRPSAARTIRGATACAYGFAVGIFAVEVGFRVVEVAATFKGDGFFRLRLRTRRGCFAGFASGSAFAFTALRRGHLSALLSQDCFARELDAIAFHAEDLYQYLIAFLQLVGYFSHAVLGDLADVQQAVGSRNNLHERAELRDPDHLAQISLADFGHGGEIVDHLEMPLRVPATLKSMSP